MKSILLATDGSAAADEALHVAVELASETHATLHVVAVHTHPTPGRGGPIAILEIESAAGAESIASQAVAAARAAGLEASSHTPHGFYGDVVDSILAIAEREGAELIVVGSRGLNAVEGVIMGSVSRALVRRAAIPVTVVRAGSHPHAETAAAAS